MATMCDELPRQLQSWLGTNGISSPLSVASVGEAGITIAPLSFRSSQSFRILNSRQCVYEALDEDDQDTLENIRTDGRITVHFEVCAPTSQQVRIQGRGVVYDRGSNAYNAIAPRSSNWFPPALVAVTVQRVWVSNAGPLITPPSSQEATPPAVSRSRSPRDASEARANTARRSSSNSHQVENWGWPTGGDACCVT